MKKIILIGTVSLLLPSFFIANAQSTSTLKTLKQSLEEKRVKIESEREQIKERVERAASAVTSSISSSTATTSIKRTMRFFSSRFSQVRNERINQYAESMIEKLNDAILRIEKKIQEKDARIQTLEAQGIDVSRAKVRLQESQDYLNSAKTKLNLLPEKIKSTLNSQNPQESFSNVREEVKNILADIRRSHDKMVMSLTGLNWVKSQLVKSSSSSSPVSSTSSTSTTP